MVKNQQNSRQSKFPAMITYIIAVLVLVCGLVIPLNPLFTGGKIDWNDMPILQVTGAVQALLANFGVKFKLPFGNPLTSYSATISFFGLTKLDFGAILLILYTLATLIAVILLIPVCAMGRRKARPRVIAMVGEIVALIFLLFFILFDLTARSRIAIDAVNFNIYIPFGVTLLMLILQSLIYFKGSGFIKTVGFILAALAVLFGIFNVALIIPKLGKPISSLADFVGGKKEPFVGLAALFALGGGAYLGGDLILLLFTDFDAFIKAAITEPLKSNPGIMIANIIVLILGFIILLDLILCMCGLGKRTKKSMLISNLLRYIFELLFIIGLFIILFTCKGNIGLYLYLLTFIVLIQLIIAIARLAHFRKAKKKGAKSDPVVAQPAPAPKSAPSKVNDTVSSETAVAVAPATVTAFEPVKTEVVEKNIVYNVNTVYNGPLDKFIVKLTNEEKVEFAKIFLERNYNSLSNLPEYVVGGDNSKFFSAVFIYLARVRSLVSDGLMNKMFEEVNLL